MLNMRPGQQPAAVQVRPRVITSAEVPMASRPAENLAPLFRAREIKFFAERLTY